jgi:hypothetical protein
MKGKRIPTSLLLAVVSMNFLYADSFAHQCDCQYVRHITHGTSHSQRHYRCSSIYANKEETQFDSLPTKIDKSLRRIGGRRKNIRRKVVSSPVLTSLICNLLDKNRKFVLWTASALLLWVLVMGRIFNSSINASSSYVYYQSSVVESRIIGPDGNVQTSRKETYQSNMPDLVRERLKRQQQRSSTNEEEIKEYQRTFQESEDRILNEQMQLIEKSSDDIMREFESFVQAY